MEAHSLSPLAPSFTVCHLVENLTLFHKAQADHVSSTKLSKVIAEKYEQMTENEKMYVVERLLDVREGDQGNLEFLTKWEGYSENEITWETIESFNGLLDE
jgi:hypothetical protein